MPELPEVESVRRDLVTRVQGNKVTWVEPLLPRMVKCGTLDDIVGVEFTSINRRGKFLFIETSGEMTVYIHLRMSGTLLWRKGIEDNPSHIRIVIGFQNGRLLFRDPRTLGGIWINRKGEHPWKKMGLEPFDDNLTPEVLQKLLVKRSIPIKTALLDQGTIAGIGNIYASEILFDAKIDPRRPANSISNGELLKVLNSTRTILNAAIEANGTTLKDFKLSNGRGGEFANFLKVYAKKEEECYICKSKIERIVQSQRSTFFCPSCQTN